MSKFITIEGVEGVGKSTVARYIHSFITTEKAAPAIITREPGGTKLAENIRNLLLDTEDETVYQETELLLFFAARKQHAMNMIMPNLAKGINVICDRYVDASYAYQGGGRGMDYHWIEKLSKFTDIPTPDITILLTASSDTTKLRMSYRNTKDRIESEQQEFFVRVQNAYLQLAADNPNRYHIIDANDSLLGVQAKVREILQNNL